jgi:threonylcarbamoyladenosine tRNA methylthiotransferase MtaB
MSPDGFHTITLGCKLNQFDSAGIEGELVRRGLVHEPDPGEAAVVVINTCTVTHRADADARKLIRRVRRQNPTCRLLVTGCYAESDAAAIRAVGGVDRVFGNRDKPQLPRILDELGVADVTKRPGGLDPVESDRGCDAAIDLPGSLHFGKRSRAFLKVQDGCRLACSYCIIPEVRGPSRSVPVDRLMRAARDLFDNGYPEIVLTGINTGDYGRDLEPAIQLSDLLRQLLPIAGPNRFRLNSLEPRTLTDEIIGIIAEDSRLAPHVQVPLQSGSDETLRGMRRNYRVRTWLERVERLRSEVPHAAIGADVIVGFPGETDRHFRETYETIADSPANYLHVFSWSPRPGTPAAERDDRVPDAVITERSARLRTLGAELSARFRRSFVGREMEAVVLGPDVNGAIRVLTGNFIEGTIDDPSLRARDRIRVRGESIDRARLRMQVVEMPKNGSERRAPLHVIG